MEKKSRNTKRETDLSVIEGTVGYLVATKHEFIDGLCLSNKTLDEVKFELITFIKDNTKDQPKRDEIINVVSKQKNKLNLLQYIYNLYLTSTGLETIKAV